MNATCEFAGQLGSSRMAVSTSIMFVVDDHISVHESLELLIPTKGWRRRHSPLHKNSSTIPSPFRATLS
jgi:hypothetical protein